jgi:hypothetical protein
MQGWIKLHRKIQDHWVYSNAEYYKAWSTILFQCNHADQKVLIKGTLIDCKRGQSVNSLDTWVKIFKGGYWNKSKLRRFLKLLESDSMIVFISNTKTTHLSVCNYDSYQGERNANETQVKRKRNANETQTTPNKNVKKENNVKNDNKILSDFDQALKDFSDMRKKIKKPLTDKAQSMILKKLGGFTSIQSEQIEILNNSTMNCWQGVFALKNNNGNQALNNIQKIEKELDDQWIKENS